MQQFFTIIGDIFSALNGFHVIGNISVLHLMISSLVALVIVKFTKGRK